MKRVFRGLALAAIAAGLALGGCAQRDGTSEDASGAARHIIRIAGSDDVYPLARALAAQYEKAQSTDSIVFLPPTHTRGGAAGIQVGDADIGLLSRPLSREEKGRSTTYLHLAHDLIVFATHPDVGVDSLSRQQLLDIYSGRITNWKDVGGSAAEIVVLDRPEHTSVKMILRQKLFGSSFAITPKATAIENPDDMMTSLTVVENAIGYLSFGNAVLSNVGVKFIAVDEVRPTLDDFRRGRYAYTRPFGFVIGPSPSRAAMRFIKFMYSEGVRRTIEGHGFAPITMDLIIGVLPEQDLLAQEQRYAPMVDYLSERLGLQITVELRLLPSYGDVIDEFQAGRINAAFLGSLAFALARAQAGVEPIARPEKNGVSQYRSLIVTRKDSGIEGWADLRGKSFGFVDKATTAGYLYPLIYFRNHGVRRPRTFLGSIVFTGSHDLLFKKVFDGELDAGAAKDLMLDEVSKARPEISRDLRVLSVSPPVPNNTFVLTGDLKFPCFDCHDLVPVVAEEIAPSVPRAPEDFNELITGLLLGLHESKQGRMVLAALGADRFVRTTVDDLREVNRMIRQAGFDPSTYRP